MALPAPPRSALRTHILSLLQAPKVPLVHATAGTLRTPEALKAGVVNPLRRMDKSADSIPRLPRTGHFNG